MNRLDIPGLVAAGVAAAALIFSGAAVSGVESALLVPALFVLAGLLGPLWQAARLTCRLLIAMGTSHLLAFGATACAQLVAEEFSAWWHLLAQLLFVVGLALLLLLAAAYPEGPIPRPARWAFAACAIPILAGLSGPTPAVLGHRSFGPVAELLPPWIAPASVVVLGLPLIAAVIAVVRFVRDGREIRARLLFPLAAIVVVGILMSLGAVAPGGFSTAAFLLAAPLLPVTLIAGSRPVAPRTEPRLPDQVAAARLDRLTPREREVLELMAEGCGNAEIGRSLHISLSAVEKHSTAIFSKLGVGGRVGQHRRVAAVVTYLRGSG